MDFEDLSVQKPCRQCGEKFTITGNLQSVTKRKLCRKCAKQNTKDSNHKYIEKIREVHNQKRRKRYLRTGR